MAGATTAAFRNATAATPTVHECACVRPSSRLRQADARRRACAGAHAVSGVHCQQVDAAHGMSSSRLAAPMRSGCGAGSSLQRRRGPAAGAQQSYPRVRHKAAHKPSVELPVSLSHHGCAAASRSSQRGHHHPASRGQQDPTVRPASQRALQRARASQSRAAKDEACLVSAEPLAFSAAFLAASAPKPSCRAST